MNLRDQKNSDTLVGMFVKGPINDSLNESLYSIAMQNVPVDLIILHDGLSDADLDKLRTIAKEPTVKVKGKAKRKNEDGVEEDVDEVITESAGSSLSHSIHKVEVGNFADVFNVVFQAAKENGYRSMSITEPDDVYSIRWFELVDEWHKENPDISIFTPLIKHMNFGAFQGFMNESCWAEGMSEEVGKYDNNLLLKFNFALQPLGAVYMIDGMTKEDGAYEERGGALFPMKSGIKLFNHYEFFLRSTYNDIKAMNIPRIGYELRMTNAESYDHRSSKIPGNLLSISPENGGVSVQEAQFWSKYATDAYFMAENDNTVTYEPAN